MPSLGQIVDATRRVVVTFGDVELKIAYRPGAVTPRLQRAIRQAQIEGDVDTVMLEMLIRLVASWDLTDDDGALVPLTTDALADLPVRLLSGILVALGEDLAPDPLKGGVSSNGSLAAASSGPSQTGTSS